MYNDDCTCKCHAVDNMPHDEFCNACELCHKEYHKDE